MDRFAHIDESALNRVDRLGLAYCRLNSWEWDEILGPKPEGFDALPNYDPKEGKLFHRKVRAKEDYIRAPMVAITAMIGHANMSRCWWKFALGKTEEEWFRWFMTKNLP